MTPLQGLSQFFKAFRMALNFFNSSYLGISSVAIHDKSHMTWNSPTFEDLHHKGFEPSVIVRFFLDPRHLQETDLSLRRVEWSLADKPVNLVCCNVEWDQLLKLIFSNAWWASVFLTKHKAIKTLVVFIKIQSSIIHTHPLWPIFGLETNQIVTWQVRCQSGSFWIAARCKLFSFQELSILGGFQQFLREYVKKCTITLKYYLFWFVKNHNKLESRVFLKATLVISARI